MIVDDILESVSLIEEMRLLCEVPSVVKGRDNRIACPFGGHRSSKTFSYSDSHWHCHACNDGGDVINFVARRDQVTMGEAIGILAKRTKTLRPTTTAELDAWRERQMERAADRVESCDYLAICGACGRADQLRGKHYARGDWTSTALLEGLCKGWKLGEFKVRCPDCTAGIPPATGEGFADHERGYFTDLWHRYCESVYR